MPTKMLNPNTTLIVVNEAGVVNPLAPTAAELAAGLNISCAVTRGYTLNPTDSDTDDTASICDTGNVQTRLFDNYEGEITMFKEGNLADAASIFSQAFEYFKTPDKRFWVYRRLGKKSTVAIADGDIVEGFLFANDRTRSVDGGDAGPVQFTVPMLAQGNYTGFTFVGTTSLPTVTSLTPATGPVAGGTAVTLTGTGFGSVFKVRVDNTVVPATVVSGTSITIVTPAHAAATVNIRVTNPAGESVTAAGNQYIYA